MNLLEQMAVSILSFFCSVLSVIAWPLLFVGDLLNLPGKYLRKYDDRRRLSEFARNYGIDVLDGDTSTALVRKIADAAMGPKKDDDGMEN